MQIYYLEIVTQEVDATCATYARLHGVAFGEGDPGLGNARTAALLAPPPGSRFDACSQVNTTGANELAATTR